MTKTAVSIKGLKKEYAGGVQALKGIDLEIKEGDFFALLGPNGAGKSTTIGVLCSLVNKTGGEVKIFGYDIDKDWEMAKRQLGVVPQEFNFGIFEKVEDIVITQAGYYGVPLKLARERTEKYLKQLGLWEKRNVSARMLSGGMKRRLMIARALVHEPKVLILDEPTAGVDIELRRSMWEFVSALNTEGRTIILTTHYLEEAEELCRNIAIIDKGEIVVNTSMKSLLSKVEGQTIILDVDKELKKAPTVKGYNIRLKDESTIEASIEKDKSINDLFTELKTQGIHILSMRNKRNRLEELFLKLVDENKSVKEKEEIKVEKKKGGKKK
jgi:ABC-2 type transport system ATP-binding protein